MKHVLALIALAAMAACTTTPEGTDPRRVTFPGAGSEPLPARSDHLPAGPEALRLLIHAPRDAGMIATSG